MKKEKIVLSFLPVGILVGGACWLVSYHLKSEALIIGILGAGAIASVGVIPWVDKLNEWID